MWKIKASIWIAFLAFAVFVVSTLLIFVVSVSLNTVAHYVVAAILSWSISWLHTCMWLKRYFKFLIFTQRFQCDGGGDVETHWKETFGFSDWRSLLWLNGINIILMWAFAGLFFLLTVVNDNAETHTYYAEFEYLYFHTCFFLFFFFVLDVHRNDK
jgi:hypothetical protein